MDGEYWILQGKTEDTGLDFSLTGGLHMAFANEGNFDTVGFEIVPQLSGHVTRNLELCGALALSFEKIQDAPDWIDDTFTTAHIVPGIEYRLSDSIDLLAEVGVGLNDNSFSYVCAGIAYYIR